MIEKRQTVMEELQRRRAEIDKITEGIVELIARRKRLVLEIKALKRNNGLGVIDVKRHEEMVRKARYSAEREGVDPNVIERIIWVLIEYGIRLQEE